MKPKSRGREVIFLGGWLFTDLLLLLMFLFFIGNIDAKSPPTLPTPTVPHLELTYKRISLVIDANGLLNNVPAAKEAVKRQVRQWHNGFLATRRVGLVVTYAGAPTDAQIHLALDAGQRIEDVLHELGKQWSPFKNASYYDHFYTLGDDRTVAKVDVYLFAK